MPEYTSSRMTGACVALLFALSVLGPGCGGQETPASVPDGALPGDVSLERFRVTSGGVSYEADRGVIILPENRKSLSSKLIALPFLRIQSPDPAPAEPVFSLGGGPGSPNIQKAVPQWADSLLPRHDFIMPGYRGAEGSAVLNCPEVSEALTGASGDLLGRESRERLAGALSLASARLRRQGVDLQGYTIAEVAEDCDALRSALRYNQVSLVSESYGTRVAQVYARMHPDRIRRSVMTGVNPPGHFVWEPSGIDRQIVQYAGLWEKDSTLRRRAGNLAETIGRISHDMPKRWLFLHIDPGKVRVVTFAFLYHRKTAAMAFDAYADAANGDPAGLALMSVLYNFIVPTLNVWGDFFAKGIADYDSTRDYAAEMDPPGSILGSPLSLMIWPAVTHGGAWPIVRLPDSLSHVAQSNVETLLISGNLDFSTPAEAAARELLPSLTRGRQIVLSDMGHCHDLTSQEPEAYAHLLKAFLDTGNADASLFTYLPMDFHLSVGCGTIAKIAVAAAAVLLAGFATLLWYIGRTLLRISRERGLTTA
jgi:pimeloyl-ACP methyl ester carboxylesterase